MISELNNKQQQLVNYLLNHSYSGLSQDEIYKLISGMSVADITDCMEEFRKITEALKNTGLGRELL